MIDSLIFFGPVFWNPRNFFGMGILHNQAVPDHQALVGAQLFGGGKPDRIHQSLGNQTRFLNDISPTRITFLRLNQDFFEAKR